MKYSFRTGFFLLLGLLVLKIPQTALATHVIGGEVVAEAVSCNSYSYQIKIILYVDAGSDVTFGSGVISFGDGNHLNLDTHQDFEYKELDKDGLYKVAVLELQHSFPGPGQYLINFREFNRNPEIANMLNSVSTPFYIESLLSIDPLIACNSTPVLSDSLQFITYINSPYVLPLNATDPDGDSLSFTFVTPKQDRDIEVEWYYTPEQFDIHFIEGATASDGVSKPTLSANQGQLVWDAPNIGGEFTFALQVNEWRKIDHTWVNIGYITRDMTIHVKDTLHHTNGFGYITDPEDSITDIHDEITKPVLDLYPNPTAGPIILSIREDGWQGGTVSIYNIIGQLVAQKLIDGKEIDFNLTNESDGVYIVILRYGTAHKVARVLKK